ncbi:MULTISPECIES: glutathione binding-like protein [unclassified Bradyrhizobium]|uniref:glutathione binding-like protein n=1 Tax=unclassified Bradyrhizobium TaxID=2631580 RepID=UPI00339AEFED
MRLAQVPFVAGDQFTAADITALVAVDFATEAIEMPIPRDHASTKRWYVEVSSRPSAAA